MPAVDITTIYNAFIEATGHFTEDVFRRSARKRPIIDLVSRTRGVYPWGSGDTIFNLTSTRSFPLEGPGAPQVVTTAPLSRAVMSASTDLSGANAPCDPPQIQLTTGQLRQQIQPSQLNAQSGYYCLLDILMDQHFEKTCENVIKWLTDVSAWIWGDWYEHDYWVNCGHKITQQTAGVTDGGLTNYSTAPTGRAIWGIFEDIYTQLDREGGDQPLGYDIDTGAPVFGAIVGDEAWKTLLRDNTTLSTNIQYAWMGKEGDSPILPSGRPRKVRHFGGWVIHTTSYPRRFSLQNGTYRRIPKWEVAATQYTVGTGQRLSTNYKNASYEEILFYHPSTYRSLAVTPRSIDGFNFNPTTWMGDFNPLNITDRQYNPRGEKIFFDAVFRDAAEPLNTDLGYAYLFLNCGFDKSSSACATGTAPSSSSSA